MFAHPPERVTGTPFCVSSLLRAASIVGAKLGYTAQPIWAKIGLLPVSERVNVVRFAILLVPIVLAACADQSRGSALNECRTRYYLDDPAIQEQQIPDCMKARSFEAVAACNPTPDEYEWDWQVQAFSFNSPRCYEPVGSVPWLATFFSPM